VLKGTAQGSKVVPIRRRQFLSATLLAGVTMLSQTTKTVASTDQKARNTLQEFGASAGSTSDATRAFNSAMRALPDGGTLAIVGTFRLNGDVLSNRNVDLSNGKLEAHNSQTYTLRLNGVSNINFRGGGEINGRRSLTKSAGSQEFGIWCRGASNIHFYETQVNDCYKDGIYLGADDAGKPCSKIHFHDVVIRNSGRNNLSICHADGVYGSVTAIGAHDFTGHYSGPWAGLDVEPNRDEYVDNVDLNVSTSDNQGNGIEIYWLAGTVNRKVRINIRHTSRTDNLRGLRIGRFKARSTGNEAIINYEGIINDPLNAGSAGGGFLLDDLGGGVVVNVNAIIQQRIDTKSLIAIRRNAATNFGITGVPKMRLKVKGIGGVRAVFNPEIFRSLDMTQDCQLMLDGRYLTTRRSEYQPFAGGCVITPVMLN
jgi:hypothetical protein